MWANLVNVAVLSALRMNAPAADHKYLVVVRVAGVADAYAPAKIAQLQSK
jgi:hypothetical protein